MATTYGRSRSYFLISQFVTGTGDQLYDLCIALLVYRATKSPAMLALTLGVVYGGSVVGYFLVPLLKRYGNIRVTAWTDLISALGVLSVLFIPVTWTWSLQLFLGCVRAVNRPFAQALIPQLSESDADLTRLNADFQLLNTLSMVFGFLLSGIITASGALPVGFALNAVSFVVCAGLTLRIRVRDAVENLAREKAASATPLGHLPTSGTYLQRLAAAAQPLRRDPFLFAILGPNSLIFGLVIAFDTQLVFLVGQKQPQPIYYVVTELVMSLSIMLTMLMIRRRALMPRDDWVLSRVWLATTAGAGLLYGVAVFSPGWIAMTTVLALSAVFDSTSGVAQMNLLHHRIEDSVREQLLSFRFLSRNLGKALVSFFVGLAAQGWGVNPTLGAVGLAIALLASGIYVFLRVQVRIGPSVSADS